MSAQAEAFAHIFRGRADVWGAIHGECIHESPTLDHFTQHLAGTQSLGIYPLLDDGTCYWAAADDDQDDLPGILRMMEILADMGLNVGVYIERSKTKGHHLGTFFDAPVPAKAIRRILKVAANKAGVKVEIFPKQDELTPEAPFGNYVHLPYFGHNGDGRRMMLRPDTLTPMPLPEFLDSFLPFPAKHLPLIVAPLPEEETRKNPAGWLGELLNSGNIPIGERRPSLVRLAGGLRTRGIDEEAAVAIAQRWADTAFAEPLTDEEIERHIRGPYRRYGNGDRPHQPAFPRTDAGNGELLAHLYGDRVRFDHRRRRWLLWRDHWWQPDAEAEVQLLAKEAARRRYQDAPRIDDLKERDAEARWAIACESRMRIDAALALASSERPIADAGKDWDSNPWLLGVANGVLDLSTGELRDGQPEDRITMHSPVAYDPDAPCPHWLAFLDRIMAGNVALIDFLQRAMGYTLTGDVSEQVLFFAYGTGANGKSTFLTALLDAFGDYGRQAAPGLLLARRGERHPTEYADLETARLVASVEVDEGRRLAEGLVKWLTGGDRMKARRMRQDFYEFRPTYKLWLAANHKPIITGTDWAIWRRIRLVPFTVVIPPEEQDPHLPDTLRQELPGILAWAVQGCLDWQRDGLGAPPEVAAATEAYRAEQDVLADFIEECCSVDRDLQVTAAALYKAYSEWCKEAGEKPVPKNAFGMRLPERGFTPDRKGGRRLWQGIGLRDGPRVTNLDHLSDRPEKTPDDGPATEGVKG